MADVDNYVRQRVERLASSDLQRKPNKWLAQMPQAAKAQRVLDIGCGLACESIAWTRAGKQVTAIDFNFDLLKAARDLVGSQGLRVDFVVADATYLPFRDAAFDIAYSDALFEHVPNWQGITLESKRVLAQNGLFFVRTINKQCPYNPEINYFHFYPWLPQSLKNPILRWIIRNRPSWVNYTKFPAVNWFTHKGLARFLRGIGFQTYEIFDLARRESTAPCMRSFFFLIELLQRFPVLRHLAYPVLGMVQILAVNSGIQSPRMTAANEARIPKSSQATEGACRR